MTKPLLLDVVDQLGNPLYQATEWEIHQQGLLHQELIVWFYTDYRGLIFKMSDRKNPMFPELLDVTVSRHILPNKSLEDSVVEAIKKQTYMDISFDKLEYLGQFHNFYEDRMSSLINNTLVHIFTYDFQRNMDNLRQEMVMGNGFFEFNIKEFDDMEEQYLNRFVCFQDSNEGDTSFQVIKNHLRRLNII